MRRQGVNPTRTSYLLRMFNLSFAAIAILPLLVYLHIFINYEKKAVGEGPWQLEAMVLIIGTTSLLLFFLLSRLLRRIVWLSHRMKRVLMGRIDTGMISELTKGDGEGAELARAFEGIMQKLETNIKDLEETKKTLYDVLTRVGQALTSIENFDVLITLILETAADALGAQRGIIVSVSEEGFLSLKAQVGLDEFPSAKLMQSVRPLLEATIKEKDSLFSPLLIPEGKGGVLNHPLVCTPLIFRDKIWGVICLSGKRRGGDFTEDEMQIVCNLSYQIAISFENAALSKDVEKTYFETIAALALAVEAKDSYSRGHSERVGGYAVQLGKAMALGPVDIKTLRDAARLHDIGKIGIADNILKKAGVLSIDEREIMKKHPLIGESIARPLKTFIHLLEPIRHHHELLDGSGYPDGLKADEIPLLTRILTIADIFDALVSERVYRQRLDLEGAKRSLQEMAEAGQVDQEVVAVLFKQLEDGVIVIPADQK